MLRRCAFLKLLMAMRTICPTATVRPERLTGGWTRDRILAELHTRNIPCSVGVCGELYLEKAFERAGLRPSKRFPVARELGETSIAFPVHPGLTDNDMQKIGDAVKCGTSRSDVTWAAHAANMRGN